MDKSFLAPQKKYAANAFAIARKRATQKAAEATGDMIGNRIAEKNYTEAASKSTHENLKKSTQPTELPKEIYVPAEKRQQINFDYYNYKYIIKMAYGKITNLQNQTGKQIKFFTSLLTSILYYCNDA